jgi:CRP-like cAMP-binding protein
LIILGAHGHRCGSFLTSWDALSVIEREMQSMDEDNLLLNIFRHQEGAAYPAGQTVFEAGARGDTVFVVIEGEVAIRLSNSQTEIAAAGSIFGEMALIDDGPRSATVTTKTPCRLLEIDRRRFDFLVSQTPFFARAVMRIMADRLRKANARSASL